MDNFCADSKTYKESAQRYPQRYLYHKSFKNVLKPALEPCGHNFALKKEYFAHFILVA